MTLYTKKYDWGISAVCVTWDGLSRIFKGELPFMVTREQWETGDGPYSFEYKGTRYTVTFAVWLI